ncbi:MAG TPA: hypothetical protein VKB58_01965 [Terriglobales bacterium]|jgi:hypothetical protein|nr:hypothetical protein [Terriglobales bacterium]
MLFHQFIVVMAAWVRRFDSIVLHALAVMRRVAARVRIGSSDLQET